MPLYTILLNIYHECNIIHIITLSTHTFNTVSYKHTKLPEKCPEGKEFRCSTSIAAISIRKRFKTFKIPTAGSSDDHDVRSSTVKWYHRKVLQCEQ